MICWIRLQEVIKDLSLDVPGGKVLALVGLSGGGKFLPPAYNGGKQKAGVLLAIYFPFPLDKPGHFILDEPHFSTLPASYCTLIRLWSVACMYMYKDSSPIHAVCFCYPYA